MQRVILWAMGLSIGGLTLLFVAMAVFADINEFSLENATSERIAHASINVAGRSFVFKNIAPGARISGTYSPSDSTLSVRIEMSSGRVWSGGGQYITNGISLRHDFIVSDVGIETIESRLKTRR